MTNMGAVSALVWAEGGMLSRDSIVHMDLDGLASIVHTLFGSKNLIPGVDRVHFFVGPDGRKVEIQCLWEDEFQLNSWNGAPLRFNARGEILSWKIDDHMADMTQIVSYMSADEMVWDIWRFMSEGVISEDGLFAVMLAGEGWIVSPGFRKRMRAKQEEVSKILN